MGIKWVAIIVGLGLSISALANDVDWETRAVEPDIERLQIEIAKNYYDYAVAKDPQEKTRFLVQQETAKGKLLAELLLRRELLHSFVMAQAFQRNRDPQVSDKLDLQVRENAANIRALLEDYIPRLDSHVKADLHVKKARELLTRFAVASVGMSIAISPTNSALAILPAAWAAAALGAGKYFLKDKSEIQDPFWAAFFESIRKQIMLELPEHLTDQRAHLHKIFKNARVVAKRFNVLGLCEKKLLK